MQAADRRGIIWWIAFAGFAIIAVGGLLAVMMTGQGWFAALSVVGAAGTVGLGATMAVSAM